MAKVVTKKPVRLTFTFLPDEDGVRIRKGLEYAKHQHVRALPDRQLDLRQVLPDRERAHELPQARQQR